MGSILNAAPHCWRFLNGNCRCAGCTSLCRDRWASERIRVRCPAWDRADSGHRRSLTPLRVPPSRLRFPCRFPRSESLALRNYWCLLRRCEIRRHSMNLFHRSQSCIRRYDLAGLRPEPSVARFRHLTAEGSAALSHLSQHPAENPL